MRLTSAYALAFVAAVLSVTPALAADAGRHSGQVVEVRPDGKLVIEEQGPWLGPGTGLVRRTIDVTPQTAIRMVRPTGTWEDNASPGYELSAGRLDDIKAGDFVTVVPGAGRGAAGAVDVVRGDDSGGLALPRSGR